jgi:hypothetical protein
MFQRDKCITKNNTYNWPYVPINVIQYLISTQTFQFTHDIFIQNYQLPTRLAYKGTLTFSEWLLPEEEKNLAFFFGLVLYIVIILCHLYVEAGIV